MDSAINKTDSDNCELLGWAQKQKQKIIDEASFDVETLSYAQKDSENERLEYVYRSQTQIIVYFDMFMDVIDYRIDIADINSYEDIICFIQALSSDRNRAWIDLKTVSELIDIAEGVLADKCTSVIAEQKKKEWQQKLHVLNLSSKEKYQQINYDIFDELDMEQKTLSRGDEDNEFLLSLLDAYIDDIEHCCDITTGRKNESK